MLKQICVLFALSAVAFAGPACNGDSDLAAIKSNWNDFNPSMQSCAKGCLFKSQCTADCIAKKNGVSGECASCFGSGATCVATSCTLQCLLDPSSPKCCDCAKAKCEGGEKGLLACTGLVPGETLPRCSKPSLMNVMMMAGADTAQCNDSDAAMIKAHWDDFNSMEQKCAKGCLFKSECTGNCIATKVGGMSKQCGNCFGSGATCVAKNCAMKCLLNPSSKSCCDCARSSCGSGLESCTGFVAGTSYPHCDG